MTAPNSPEEHLDNAKPGNTRIGKSARQSFAAVRLRKHSDFQRAYAAGRKRQSASMSWFLAPRIGENEPASARVGLTTGKVLGKAHERNGIKRRMREALRRHLDLLPQGVDLILHPRRMVLTIEFTKLETEIVRILTQARAEAMRVDRAQRDVTRPASHVPVVSPA